PVLIVLRGDTKDQHILHHVRQHTESRNPQSTWAMDTYCAQKERAKNVSNMKGQSMDTTEREDQLFMLLERGAYQGYSAVHMGGLLSPGARLITVELNPTVHTAITQGMVEFAGPQDRITVVVILGVPDVISQLKKYNVDAMVFLDPWKDGYLPDALLLEECDPLRKKTVLPGYNVICPGTWEFLAHIPWSRHFKCTYSWCLEYIKAVVHLVKAVWPGPGSNSPRS
uniref:catechol O-methyltransferase n=1 Tax=Otolemur garnettii TaxID=30611 RepID=H0XXE9_OTOGA